MGIGILSKVPQVILLISKVQEPQAERGPGQETLREPMVVCSVPFFQDLALLLSHSNSPIIKSAPEPQLRAVRSIFIFSLFLYYNADS